MVIPVPSRNVTLGTNVSILTLADKYIYLLCFFCGKLAIEPVQTLAGHRHCAECLTLHRRAGNRCRLCVLEGVSPEEDCVTQDMIYFSDRGAKQDIRKLIAKCVLCGYVASVAEMEHHLHPHGYMDLNARFTGAVMTFLLYMYIYYVTFLHL